MAVLWKRKSFLKSERRRTSEVRDDTEWAGSEHIPCAISRTKRWNGSLRISSSVDFWYLRISRKATVPGLQHGARRRERGRRGGKPMADDQPPQHHPKPADKLDRSLPVAVGLFHTTSGGRRFAGGFGGQLLARRFATGRFTSGLFRASHREDRLLTNRHGRHDDKREVNHNAAAGIRRTREGKDETGEI